MSSRGSGLRSRVKNLNEEKEFNGTGKLRRQAETSPGGGRMRRKKKKGETAVQPQIHPRIMIPKLAHFARLISVPWSSYGQWVQLSRSGKFKLTHEGIMQRLATPRTEALNQKPPASSASCSRRNNLLPKCVLLQILSTRRKNPGFALSPCQPRRASVRLPDRLEAITPWLKPQNYYRAHWTC